MAAALRSYTSGSNLNYSSANRTEQNNENLIFKTDIKMKVNVLLLIEKYNVQLFYTKFFRPRKKVYEIRKISPIALRTVK